MSDQKQGAQQAQSAEGKLDAVTMVAVGEAQTPSGSAENASASCSSAASSGRQGIRAMQTSDASAKSDAIATYESSAPASANAGTAAADLPNAVGGASSAAQSMGGSASGAQGGEGANPGNVCASAADASIAVEAAALCGRAPVGEFEGWDG
jgi:hypothetical protein